MAEVLDSTPRVISRMKEVKKEVNNRAKILGVRATSLLAAHRHSGSAKIRVTRGKVDSFVSLEDPAGNAATIEWGRRAGTSANGRRYPAMQGLYILHRTVGLR